MPGRTNLAADAVSRYPDPSVFCNYIEVNNDDESLLVATIDSEISSAVALSWSTLAKETDNDSTLCNLRRAIYDGFSGVGTDISEYLRYKNSLYVADSGVILYNDRVVVPSSLRKLVLRNLHSAHQGVAGMLARAETIVFWPGITHDVQRTRDGCYSCNTNAPSQAKTPAEELRLPSMPFQQVFADFFTFGGRHYLIVGDRLSGWPEIYMTPVGTQYAGSKGLVRCLRSFFATFGCPEELSSDGGPEFIADNTQKFLHEWNVSHRVSSAYHAQSNGRAEVAVKSAKRLLRSNVGPDGTLDNNEFLRAMLQFRNTPDPDCKLSPAQIVFGRPLRDAFSFINRGRANFKKNVDSRWRQAWKLKEVALRNRYARWCERYNEHTKDLLPLRIGDRCFVQNQEGLYKHKWDRSGIVVDVLPHSKYKVKLDGSGRLTDRNRRFLRYYKPASPNITEASTNVPVNMMNLRKRNHPHNGDNENKRSTPDSHVIGDVIDQALQEGEHDIPTGGDANARSDHDVHSVPETEDQTKSTPLALRRLRPYNLPGLKELEEAPPETRLRIRK